MSKMRKQPIGPYSSFDFDLEPGDRTYLDMGRDRIWIYDLRESTGRHKQAAGELTPHLVRKNGAPRLARRDKQGIWHWR